MHSLQIRRLVTSRHVHGTMSSGGRGSHPAAGEEEIPIVTATPVSSVPLESLPREGPPPPPPATAPSPSAAAALLQKQGFSVENATPYVVEFLGTFTLLFVVGWCALAPMPAPWGPVVISLVYMIAVHVCRPFSGGHLNPSVSLGLCLTKRINGGVMFGYWLAQCLGGILGSCAYVVWYNGKYVLLCPKVDYDWWQAMIVEALYTATLCIVVRNCASTSRPEDAKESRSPPYALVIGCALLAGMLAGEHISGAFFNPAAAIGVYVTSSMVGAPAGWYWYPEYILFQFVGSIIAAAVFNVCGRDASWDSLDELCVQPRREETSKDCSLPMKLAAEFVGTFMLMFTIGCSTFSGLQHTTPVAAGAYLFCMFTALWVWYCGHFNPVVTLAVTISDQDATGMKECGAYIVLQTVAAMLAAFLFAAVHGVRREGMARTFELGLSNGYGWPCAICMEAAMTFVFVLAYLATLAVAKRKQEVFRKLHLRSVQAGIVIGLSFAITSLAASYFATAGLLNPALAVSVSTTHLLNGGTWWTCLVFIAAELVGGSIAGIVMRMFGKRLSRSDSAPP